MSVDPYDDALSWADLIKAILLATICMIVVPTVLLLLSVSDQLL